MTDDGIDSLLGSWLKSSAAESPSALESARSVLATVRRDRVAQGSRSLFAPVQLAAVVAAVVAIGGLLFVTVQDRDAGPGAAPQTTTDPPAIIWRSNVVDLRADGLELRIGDEVYTTEGEDVIVGTSGYIGQFGISPHWTEDGRRFWLALHFFSDGETWEVNPWLQLDPTIRPDEAETPTREGDPVAFESSRASVDFEPGGRIERPLGETFEGDWQLEGHLEVPTCGSPRIERLDVTLTFENARLAVTPREPTLLERIAEDFFGRGDLFGGLVHRDIARPSPRVLDCPDLSGDR